MNYLEAFCRQIRARSEDHRKTVGLLFPALISSQLVSILRQELDSMIRVIYLLTITDMDYRHQLVKDSVEGRQWKRKNSKRRITDRDMVDLANSLHGWSENVYRFGCSFIHLSAFHDYHRRDPMDMISDDERKAVLTYMRSYHHGPIEADPKFDDLIPFLPQVFEKISSNLEHYVKDLESGRHIQPD